METSSKREETPHVEAADGSADIPGCPADAADDTQPVCKQAQDEPRVVVECQPAIEGPTPEEPPTPSYTFDLQAALAAARSPSPIVDEEEDLYSDDQASIKAAPEPHQRTPSPERIVAPRLRRLLPPPEPSWRRSVRESRRKSTGGMRAEIFVIKAD